MVEIEGRGGRPDINLYSVFEDEMDEEAENRWGKSRNQAIPSHSQILLQDCFTILKDSVDINEFKDICMDWIEDEDQETQLLIKEIINPSLESQEKWEEMCAKHPYLKHFNTIPPLSYSEILGISKFKIMKIMKKLRSYVVDIYDVDVLQSMGISKETIMAQA
jgi:hypothetical protein